MKPRRTARISDTERDIMKLLWANGPMTAGAILSELSEVKTWKTQTVYVLLRRLTEKGFVKVDREAQPYQFSATMTEAESLAKTSHNSIFSLVASFIDSNSVTAEDIDALSDLIEAKKRDLEDKK